MLNRHHLEEILPMAMGTALFMAHVFLSCVDTLFFILFSSYDSFMNPSPCPIVDQATPHFQSTFVREHRTGKVCSWAWGLLNIRKPWPMAFQRDTMEMEMETHSCVHIGGHKICPDDCVSAWILVFGTILGQSCCIAFAQINYGEI